MHARRGAHTRPRPLAAALAFCAALAAGASLCVPAAAIAAPPLPTVMSTNLCADIMALSLADDAQLLSVSRRSQDPRFSSLAARAAARPGNDGSAEEVLALHPDVVLTSRRWQGHHQQALWQRGGTRVVVVPFPTTWEQVFDSTRQIGAALGREAAAESLLADLAQRLAQLRRTERPLSALYLRPNGGSAGADTYIDTIFQALGLRNHAGALGLHGWGRISLEQVVANPPDVFILGNMLHDTAYARASVSRHPLMRDLVASRPSVRLNGSHWGCSNWQLIEGAEDIARQLDALPLLTAQAHRR